MKKKLCSLSLIAGAALILTSQQSCVKELVKSLFNAFHATPVPVEFTIPITSNNGAFLLLDSVQGANIDQEIRSKTNDEYGIDDADSIEISNIYLTLDSADSDNNWANFTAVSAMLTTEQSPNVVDLGTRNDIPDTYSDNLVLNPNQTINMKEYLSGNKVYYVFYGTTRRAVTRPLKGKAHVEFYIR